MSVISILSYNTWKACGWNKWERPRRKRKRKNNKTKCERKWFGIIWY